MVLSKIIFCLIKLPNFTDSSYIQHSSDCLLGDSLAFLRLLSLSFVPLRWFFCLGPFLLPHRCFLSLFPVILIGFLFLFDLVSFFSLSSLSVLLILVLFPFLSNSLPTDRFLVSLRSFLSPPLRMCSMHRVSLNSTSPYLVYLLELLSLPPWFPCFRQLKPHSQPDFSFSMLFVRMQVAIQHRQEKICVWMAAHALLAVKVGSEKVRLDLTC